MDGMPSPEAALAAAGASTTTSAAPEVAGPARDGKPARRLRLLTLAECAAAPPRGYIIKRLIAPGDLALIIGQPGAGKSVLAPYLAHAIAAGRSVFGRRVKRGPVLYIAAEDPHGMRMRAAALRVVHGEADGLHIAAEPVDLQGDGAGTPPDEAAIIAAADRIGAIVIFLDTMARAFPGLGENDPDKMGRAVRVLRNLTAADRAVIAVHHPAKEGATPRGHGVLNGDVDVTIRLEVDATSGVRTVHLGKNRNGPSAAPGIAFTIRAEVVGTDEDGDAITAPVAEEADAEHAKGKAAPRIGDGPALLLRLLRELTAEGAGETLRPAPGMPIVRAIARAELRAAAVREGWFAEPDLLPPALPDSLPRKGVLTTAGYRRENKALETLKRKGLAGFTRDHAWTA